MCVQCINSGILGLGGGLFGFGSGSGGVGGLGTGSGLVLGLGGGGGLGSGLGLGLGGGLGFGSGLGLGLGGRGGSGLGGGGSLGLGGGANNGLGGLIFSGDNSLFSQPQQQQSLENSSGLLSQQSSLFSSKYTCHLFSTDHLYSIRRTNYCDCWWYNNKI